MALDNAYRNAVADYPSCRNPGRQYLAPRWAQPLVDHIGIHPVAKLNRPMGVCIHAMAVPRQVANTVQRSRYQPETRPKISLSQTSLREIDLDQRLNAKASVPVSEADILKEQSMPYLSTRDRELVALGAAIRS
jgi:hypothetical protein